MWFAPFVWHAKAFARARWPAGHARRPVRRKPAARRARIEQLEGRALLSSYSPFPGVVLASAGADDIGKDVFLDDSGKIVLAGRANDGTRDYAALARYTANGSLDPDFGPAPSVAIDNVSVTEGHSGTVNAVFTVTLSEAVAAAVTVDFATAPGTTNPATPGTDYLDAGGTLTFNPGELTQTITVTVYGDTTKEPNETFVVNLTNATGGAVIFDGEGLGTILNDDGGKPPKGSSADLSAADLFFLDLGRNLERDKDKSVPLATAAIDALAPMLAE